MGAVWNSGREEAVPGEVQSSNGGSNDGGAERDSPVKRRNDPEACGLTTRGTPLEAATGRSQASAPLSGSRKAASNAASDVSGSARPQGCAPTCRARGERE